MEATEENEFLELNALIDEGKYGPHGFIEDKSDGLARNKKLKTGLGNIISTPKTISTPVYVISERTILMPLDGIFPECITLTKRTNIPRLVCSAEPERCNVGNNCMGTLLNRLGSIASAHDTWELFVLYWQYKNKIMGLVVRSRDSNMRLICLNPHALNYFVTRGDKYQIAF